MTMRSALPEGLNSEGVGSLEVRWIFPGEPAAGMVGWFGRFPAEVRLVEDLYLLDPHLPGLSVKLRGQRSLEVKAYRGSAGVLEVAGRACGRLERWHKWSFQHGPPGGGNDQAGWRPVRKRRQVSWFSRADGPALAALPDPGARGGCAVELTEVEAAGVAWWSLGFEATGPPGALRGELDAAAALVFARALPGGVELGMDGSQSYAQWLRRLPGRPGTT
jgi:hypothetical protein